ncbi:hypothetical protein WN943_027044 [Citrus x changshan-huyou]
MKLHGYRYGRARFDLFPLPFSEKRGRTVLNQDSSNNVDGAKKFEEGSVEESAQSTPPDIDLFVDTKEAEENGNPNVGFVPEKQSNKIDQKNSRIKSVCSFLGHAFELSFLKHQEPCKVQQFSHALISMVDEWSKPILKGGIQKFTFKYNSVLVSSCDTKLMDTGKTENIGVGNPENMNNLICSKSFVLEEKCNTAGSSEVSIVNDANSNLSDGELNETLSNAEQKDDQNIEVLDQIDNSNKDYPPRTPPDSDMISNPEVAENGGYQLTLTVEIIQNSVSSRTLPFLKDVAEASASRKDHVLKHGKKLEANPPAPPLVSDYQERPLGNPKGNDYHAEHHTEKAFEFSRNQMQDGGQVSSDLIKELPCIRNMLEKSPFSTNGHALISACQVKEVFQKASKAEAPARSRLSKMNFNPSIHCRVTCTQGQG